MPAIILELGMRSRPSRETRVEIHKREKVGIKILIGTSICIIGASLDETSLVSTVTQHDVRYNCHKAVTLCGRTGNEQSHI